MFSVPRTSLSLVVIFSAKEFSLAIWSWIFGSEIYSWSDTAHALGAAYDFILGRDFPDPSLSPRVKGGILRLFFSFQHFL